MTGAITWNVIGQSIAIVLNQVIGWAWEYFQMPVLSHPGPGFLGSEQLLFGILFWVWASREKIELPADQPPPQAKP